MILSCITGSNRFFYSLNNCHDLHWRQTQVVGGVRVLWLGSVSSPWHS